MSSAWALRGARHSCVSVLLSIAFATFVALLSSTSTAHAEVCGDNVDGARVACACGDVVVADTVLIAGDPVVSQRCPIDGLILRTPALADSLTLDLGGFAIVGSGIGHGIRVESGGNDGARIIGGEAGAPSEIVGFGTGIVAAKAGTLARIENVAVKGSRHDGMRLRVSGALLINVTAEDNGGDGLSVSGSGGRLVGVTSSGNAGSGVRLTTKRTIVEAAADDNGRHGVVVAGGGNDLSGVTARNNGGHGVIARAGRHKTAGVRALGNHGRDLVRTRPEMPR